VLLETVPALALSVIEVSLPMALIEYQVVISFGSVDPRAGDRRAGDAHRARAVVLQHRPQAADGVVGGGREGTGDGADQGVGVRARHPGPQLHAAGGGSGGCVAAEDPEQVVVDLDRVDERCGEGQRGLTEIRHPDRARADELVHLACAEVVLAAVLAPVDFAGVVGGADGRLRERPIEDLFDCSFHS